jgi:cytochrome c-type biogenesis protein CcmH
MIYFWLVCLLLLVICCLFILVPTWRYQRQARDEASALVLSEVQRRKENVAIFKERIQELEQDRAAGTLSDEAFQQMVKELESALMTDVSQQDLSEDQVVEKSGHRVAQSHHLFLAFGMAFVVLFSIWFYHTNGALDKVAEFNQQNFSEAELAQAKEMARQGDMNALLDQLYNKLKQSPDNAEGWHLLARSAMNSERFDYAIEAYRALIRIADTLNENPAPIYGLLAQARYYQTDGRITADINDYLQKALSLDPDELNSLGLMAIDAFTGERYQEAKELWLRILTLYPDHPARTSIEAGIARADSQLGQKITGAEEQAPLPESTDNQVFIDVRVTLDASVKMRVSPGDSVFVLARNARPASGAPNVPLAVARFSVADLPLTVRLDDARAMSPMARLSSAERVTVVARISPSGSPLPQAGDFEAVSPDIAPADNSSIELLIQDQLK